MARHSSPHFFWWPPTSKLVSTWKPAHYSITLTAIVVAVWSITSVCSTNNSKLVDGRKTTPCIPAALFMEQVTTKHIRYNKQSHFDVLSSYSYHLIQLGMTRCNVRRAICANPVSQSTQRPKRKASPVQRDRTFPQTTIVTLNCLLHYSYLVVCSVQRARC